MESALVVHISRRLLCSDTVVEGESLREEKLSKQLGISRPPPLRGTAGMSLPEPGRTINAQRDLSSPVYFQGSR